MNTLNLNCFDIKISYDEQNKACASLTSSLKAPHTKPNITFNAAVSSIESMVLAHFCAGVDITTKEYETGLITAVDAIANQFGLEEEATDDGSVEIVKTRRINALVDESIVYSVKGLDWERALREHGDEETALYELQRELKVKRIESDADIDEVNAEFDVEVAVH